MARQLNRTISDNWINAANQYGQTPEQMIDNLEQSTINNARAAIFQASVFDGLQKIDPAKAAQIQNDLILVVKTEVDKLPK